MKKLKPALLLLAAAACTTAPATRPDGEGRAAVPDSAAAPQGKPLDLTLARYPGPGSEHLTAHPGKVQLIDFWATWCEPCKEAAGAYQGLYTQWKDKGLEVVGVSVDDGPDGIPAFIQAHGVTYPLLMDPAAQKSAMRYSIDSVPVTLLVDKQGLVRYRHLGFTKDELAKIQSELQGLLAE